MVTSKVCRICGSPELEPRFRFRSCSVERCTGCGFVQVTEKPSAEDLKQLYGSGYFGKGKYVEDKAAKNEQCFRMRWLNRCGVEKGARLLDAGCATGDFLAAVGNRYDVWGMDISEFAIEEAKQRCPDLNGRLHAGLIEDLDFADESFDVIALWDVIEHVWDPVTVVANLAAKLKTGGRLIMSTPNVGAWTSRLMRKRWAFMTPPEHLGFFNRSTMRLLLEKNGLEECAWVTRGKSVNLDFLIYKLGRVFPGFVPQRFVRLVHGSRIGRTVLYVPTGDIQYVGAIKRA
jgi:2-polyprenyl-3-methyl-5-hydroxy-6-metoxy-1,4-benzoquinol methylase